MRVAMLMEQLLQPVPGGTGRYSAELARALAETAAEGDGVTGWLARHDAASITRATVPAVEGPRTLLAPRPVLNRVWPLPSLGARLGPSGADVAFAPTPFAPPRGKIPLVVAIHDAVPWTAPETMTARGLKWHRQIIGRISRDADAIVVPTRAVAAALATHVPALRGEKVHVTGEGVSEVVTRVPPDASARSERLQLPQRFLLMVGTQEPRKGLDIALRALADEQTGDIPLVVIGQQGWGDVDVLTEASSYGLAPGRVRLLGKVEDADLATAYSRATAVLVPSRDEGFGLPAVEALTHGVPVLVSSAPALVEVTGAAGIVTPIGDRKALAAAIADVMSWDTERRASYSVGARAQAATHTWSATAQATWAVFRTVSAAAAA